MRDTDAIKIWISHHIISFYPWQYASRINSSIVIDIFIQILRIVMSTLGFSIHTSMQVHTASIAHICGGQTANRLLAAYDGNIISVLGHLDQILAERRGILLYTKAPIPRRTNTKAFVLNGFQFIVRQRQVSRSDHTQRRCVSQVWIQP